MKSVLPFKHFRLIGTIISPLIRKLYGVGGAKTLLLVLLLPLLLGACKPKSGATSAMSAAFDREKSSEEGKYDLDDLRRNGEIIIATLSGPETYYDYHGAGMGLQYALADAFARTEGLKVRVTVAKDTSEVLSLVKRGEADIAALPIGKKAIADAKLQTAGVTAANSRQSWAVKPSAGKLAEALDAWFDEKTLAEVQKSEANRLREVHTVRRHMQAMYLSRDRGIISVYDPLFKQASSVTGWDWKLIAAQCYQESGFDPNARSWAGAQGLMQLMPRTAAGLGVAATQVHDPQINVEAAARLIRQLSAQLSDIPHPEERIKFVLASYNGGLGHVRDAMALARKYGRDAHRWDEVAPYILGLQRAEYYRDPVVKYGYMIGSETAGYVQAILKRWQSYGGSVMLSRSPALPMRESTASNPTTPEIGKGKTAPRKNKYSSGMRIMSPDDPEFNQMK